MSDTKATQNPLKRLYNWVLSLAEKPWALLALFLIAFAESSFFLIPPDVLLIPLVLGAPTRSWRIAGICTIGSVLGGCFGYWIGATLWNSDFSHWCYSNLHWAGLTEANFNKASVNFKEYGVAYVFAAGFTPIPYKIITIASGAFGFNFLSFIAASIVGRGARFFLVSILLRRYGEPIKAIIDKHFNWLALLFTILLFGGIYLLKIHNHDNDPTEPPAKVKEIKK